MKLFSYLVFIFSSLISGAQAEDAKFKSFEWGADQAAPASAKKGGVKAKKSKAEPSEGAANSAPTETKAKSESKSERMSFFASNEAGCYEFSLQAVKSVPLECGKEIPVKYTKVSCSDQATESEGSSQAMVECLSSDRVSLKFAAAKKLLNVRMNKTYSVLGFKVEDLPEPPAPVAQTAPTPIAQEPSAVQVKASGYLALEHEITKRYGYENLATNPQANFRSQEPQSYQRNTNILSNFGIEVSKDKTTAVGLFEIGELYYGRGGAIQGARQTNVFEVRNLHLTHALSDVVSLKGGIIPTNSDPRAFVFSDHLASIQAAYTTSLTDGNFWYGGANSTSVGTKPRDERTYFGWNSNLKTISGFRPTLFWVHQNHINEQFAVSNGSGGYDTFGSDFAYNWIGAHVVVDRFAPVTWEATGIYLSGKGKVIQRPESLNSYLLNSKLSYSISPWSTVFSLEGVMTPGAEGVNNGTTPILGKRKAFYSPVDTSYMMTIATSDGADDAPGSTKSMPAGGLSTAEGLRMAIVSVTTKPSDDWTVLARAGYLGSAHKSSAYGKKIGVEFDLQASYQWTPSTAFQFDYARFEPGSYFDSRGYFKFDAAELMTLKTKFSF